MKLRDDQKLATFKCDRAKWDNFLAAAAENGTTGAALLKWFVESYTAGEIAPDIDKIPAGAEERLLELVAPLYARIDEVERRLGKSKPKPTVRHQQKLINRFLTPAQGESPKTS